MKKGILKVKHKIALVVVFRIGDGDYVNVARRIIFSSWWILYVIYIYMFYMWALQYEFGATQGQSSISSRG